MSLYIRNEETDRLARAIAERTGETSTDAVTVSLRERLRPIAVFDREERLRRVKDILRRSSARSESSLTEDELMYDEDGLPK